MSRKGNSRSQAGNEGNVNSGQRIAGDVNRENGNANDRQGNGLSLSADEIAERAYQIFEREGRMDGKDMEHWLQAERELRNERERRSGGLTAQNAPRSERQHQR